MRKKGFSTAAIVIAVIVVAILCVGTIVVINNQKEAVDYTPYMGETVVEATEANGQIADHIIGNADAPVILHEYANFQCNHCAAMRPVVEQVVADSNGQLAVVFRNLTWSAFQNSKAAAAAAEAAGLQGYWEPYAKKLFEQQAEWAYATGDERTELFDKYFDEVSDGQGDMEKFNADMESEAVQAKVKFDTTMGTEEGAEGTPAFFYNGQHLDLENGGDLVVNGQTIHYEKTSTNDDFSKLIQQIVSAQTGA